MNVRDADISAVHVMEDDASDSQCRETHTDKASMTNLCYAMPYAKRAQTHKHNKLDIIFIFNLLLSLSPLATQIE